MNEKLLEICIEGPGAVYIFDLDLDEAREMKRLIEEYIEIAEKPSLRVVK